METNDLIYLVSCAVNGVKPDPERVAGMDLDAIYKLASRHMLAATVAPALKAAGVQDERFAKALEHSALKSSTMDMEMDAVFTELDAAGIWYMPLKGTVLQHLYPVYGMRQMSDHDILFDAARADDVRRIMEGLGFCTEHFGTSHHDVYHKEPVCNFEMHRMLFGPSHEEKLYEYYRDVEKRLLGDGYEKHLSPEDFYLHVIAHDYKHYSWGGTGLRPLLDTYVCLKNESLDMAYVTKEAEKLGMAEFEAANRSLALHVFSGAELTEAERERMDHILSSGVYGSTIHHVENMMTKRGYGKLGYALDRFAVPVSRENREYAAFAAQYPFFYQHKVLLPFLPFYRILRAMKAGRFQAEAKAIKNAKKA
ncbi:MAG: nucleotidyltransferase family protein [Oscillospiraceae bacterium]|nr:nucleotidyltransferase family protein [Oscillospiraceae bacterium]